MNATSITHEIFASLFCEEQVQEMLNSPLNLPGEPNQVPLRDQLQRIGKNISICSGRTELHDELHRVPPGVLVPANYHQLILMRYFPLPATAYQHPINRVVHPIAPRSAQVWLYRFPLEIYCGHLIHSLVNSGISLNLDTSLFAIHFVIEDILDQAAFHYYCDQVRQLTGSAYDADLERELSLRFAYTDKHSWHTIYDIARVKSRFEEFFHNYFFEDQYKKVSEVRRKHIFDFLMSHHYDNYPFKGLQIPFLHIDSNLENHTYTYLKNPVLEEMRQLGVPVEKQYGNPGILRLDGALIRIV